MRNDWVVKVWCAGQISLSRQVEEARHVSWLGLVPGERVAWCRPTQTHSCNKLSSHPSSSHQWSGRATQKDNFCRIDAAPVSWAAVRLILALSPLSSLFSYTVAAAAKTPHVGRRTADRGNGAPTFILTTYRLNLVGPVQIALFAVNWSAWKGF